MIDYTLDRPYRDDPNADRWKKVSQAVVLWLRNSISIEVINAMETTGRSMDFADDFLELLDDKIHGHRYGISLEIYSDYRILDINAFNKPSEYVAELMKRYIDVFNFGTKVPALDPLHTIIDASLSKGHDVWELVLSQLEPMETFRENYGTLTISEFRSICNTIIYHLRKVESKRN